MKKNILIQSYFILGISALLLASCASSLVPLKLEESELPWLKDSINLRMEVNSATGANGSFASFTTPGYFMIIQGKRVITHLPFYGTAHFSPFLDENGFNMPNGHIDSLQCFSHKRKKSIILKMLVHDNITHYDFTLEFWEDGNAYLDLKDLNRDNMSYSGFFNPDIHN